MFCVTLAQTITLECSMVVGKFAREAAMALLRWSHTASDPNVAAAMVEKAADIKDRFDELPPAEAKASPLAPDEEIES